MSRICRGGYDEFCPTSTQATNCLERGSHNKIVLDFSKLHKFLVSKHQLTKIEKVTKQTHAHKMVNPTNTKVDDHHQYKVVLETMASSSSAGYGGGGKVPSSALLDLLLEGASSSSSIRHHHKHDVPVTAITMRTNMNTMSDIHPASIDTVLRRGPEVQQHHQQHHHQQLLKTKKKKVERTRTLLFIKILLRCIDISGDRKLYQQVQVAIASCVQRYRHSKNIVSMMGSIGGDVTLSVMLHKVLKDLLVVNDGGTGSGKKLAWDQATTLTSYYIKHRWNKHTKKHNKNNKRKLMMSQMMIKKNHGMSTQHQGSNSQDHQQQQQQQQQQVLLLQEMFQRTQRRHQEEDFLLLQSIAEKEQLFQQGEEQQRQQLLQQQQMKRQEELLQEMLWLQLQRDNNYLSLQRQPQQQQQWNGF